MFLSVALWQRMLLGRQEQRKSRRRPVRRAARVMFGTSGRSIPCVICDLSEGGGRLAVAHPIAELPRRFSLLLTKDAIVARRCEIVWTDSRFVGVKFV
jgi:PilZ domain